MTKEIKLGGTLQCEDLNGNGVADSGEPCRINNLKTPTFQYAGKADFGDFYKLTPLVNHKIKTELGTHIFSTKFGFIFKNKDVRGREFLVTTGDNPLDPSSYRIMCDQTFGKSGRGNIKLTPTLMKQVPSVQSIVGLWPLNHKPVSGSLKRILNEQGLLKTMGYKSIDELYNKVSISTEGEIAIKDSTSIIPEYPEILAGDSMAVSFRESSAMIIVDDSLLEIVLDDKLDQKSRKQWEEALRSVFYHEWIHTQDPYRIERHVPHPEQAPEFIYGQIVTQLNKSLGGEIARLWNKNELFQAIYNRYYATSSNGELCMRATFFNGIEEVRAYAVQIGSMAQKGLDQYPEVFVKKIFKSFVPYLDIVLSLATFPEGRDYVKKLLNPILANDKAKQALLDFTQNDPSFAARLRHL